MKRNSAAAGNENGVTLIEIMVAVALVGVMVTVAVPNFASFIADQRQVTGVNELVLAMTLARSEAVKQTRHVTVCKSADGSACGGAGVEWEDGFILFANTSQANTATRGADEPVIRVFPPVDGGRTLRTPDIAANFVAFRPTGTSNVTGTFILCDNRGAEHASAVVVDAAGRARVSRVQADESDLECPAPGGG